MNAKTPEDAAYQFCFWFERPSAPMVEERQRMARTYYDEFAGKSIDELEGGSNDSSSGDIPEYFQDKYSKDYIPGAIWEGKPVSIATGGCGATCMAMIVSALTGETHDPVEITNKFGAAYFTAGSGWSWDLFRVAANEYGLNCSEKFDDIRNSNRSIKERKLLCDKSSNWLWYSRIR